VWKTLNGGASWQRSSTLTGSFQIRVGHRRSEAADVVWAGTGERNSQRSVAYGDVSIKAKTAAARDERRLKTSEHIGRIVVSRRTATP